MGFTDLLTDAGLAGKQPPNLPLALAPAPALDEKHNHERRTGQLTRFGISAQQLAPHPLLRYWVCITDFSMI